MSKTMYFVLNGHPQKGEHLTTSGARDVYVVRQYGRTYFMQHDKAKDTRSTYVEGIDAAADKIVEDARGSAV